MVSSSTRIEGRLYADYLCPWCHLAAVRLHRVRQEFSAEFTIEPRAYTLMQGDLPGQRVTPHSIVSRLRVGVDLEREGAVCRPWPETECMPRSSVPALAAAKCARRQGIDAFAAYDLALYRAFFAECRDISHKDTLIDIAQEVGLERRPFVAALESTGPRDEVLADHVEYGQRYGARSLGIPLLEIGDRTMIGAAQADAYATVIRDILGVADPHA